MRDAEKNTEDWDWLITQLLQKLPAPQEIPDQWKWNCRATRSY